jgi:hypothetical protein
MCAAWNGSDYVDGLRSEREKGDLPVTYQGVPPMLSTVVDLRAIYKRVYDTVPWPEPIPSPEQITLGWKCKVTRVLGSCYPYKRIITINPLYNDSRLRDEIKDLMTHEVGHFIWRGHPVGFKSFLRSVGVAPEYVSSSSPPSAAFQAVYAEHSLLLHIWKCPACGVIDAPVDGHLDMCCRHCARQLDPQLQLPFQRLRRDRRQIPNRSFQAVAGHAERRGDRESADGMVPLHQ